MRDVRKMLGLLALVGGCGSPVASGGTGGPVGTFDAGMRACGSDADCTDSLACTVNERCDAASRLCRYDVLDGDHDGHSPAVCGGDDCDDGRAEVVPGATETCNGLDDNCNGFVDDGAAGRECAEGFVCRAGACACPAALPTSCEVAARAVCVDVQTSPDHCGACGRSCAGVATCTAGACVCPGGASFCPGSACVDLQTDRANCGACGRACTGGQACATGVCGCPTGQTLCGGRCVSTADDREHCGACAHACPASVACSGGACQCPAGTAECARACVDLGRDFQNCGACGRACGASTAGGVSCVAGLCACAGARTNCSGVCADTASDARNCGACARACLPPPNASATCAAGACGFACAAGYGDCNAAADGCETNLRTSSAHCGACGRACPAGQTCMSAACGLSPPGPLNTARHGYGVTVGSDGRVYVFGGATATVSAIASPERFDPALNTWTALTGTAAFLQSVYAPTGMLLDDGRILSYSGFDGGSVYRYAQVYDPVRGQWNLQYYVAGDGRYLGAVARGSNGHFYLFGGVNVRRENVGIVELDASGTQVTSDVVRGTEHVGGAAVTAADGRMYVFGGANGDTLSSPLGEVHVFVPATFRLVPVSVMPMPAVGPGAARGSDGRIYVAGGQLDSRGAYLNVVRVYDPAANTWSTAAPMPVPRAFFSLVALPDGRILAIGGKNASGEVATTGAYDPATNTWR